MPCEGPVHLRRATVDDAAGIAGVHADGWRRAHRDVVSESYLARPDAPMREEFWRGELQVEPPGREPWVATLEDRLIGFASGGLAHDDDADPGTGEVYVLVVTPECWERGIRTNLIEHVDHDLREHGFDRAVFWILSADSAMRAFAEHVGFRADGASRFEDCGGTPVEQLRYVKELR